VEGLFWGGEVAFRADAMHPKKGRYTAREVHVMTRPELRQNDESHRQYNQAFDAFVTQLTADGWELLPTKGDYWYSYKFRRQVKG